MALSTKGVSMKERLFLFEELFGASNEASGKPRRWLESLTPSQCREWEMPEGFKLAGDYHITRGGNTVIGGPPGIGKSRAALQLAFCGVTGEDWLGLPVHAQFKTYILQNENGFHRLKADFDDAPSGLDEFLRITPPPDFGLCFDEPGFCAALTEELDDFKPGVVVIDPWTNVTRDNTQGDYSDALNRIRECVPKGEDAPAIVIVAHTRKPKTGTEKPAGVALLTELMGSTKLASMARSAFVMQPATNETTDNRVVWTCCKNNDGEKGPRTPWLRENGRFTPCPGFDWSEFDQGSQQQKVTKEVMERLFESGLRRMTKSFLVDELVEVTGCSKSTAYEAVKPDGKFTSHLEEIDGLMVWNP